MAKKGEAKEEVKNEEATATAEQEEAQVAEEVSASENAEEEDILQQGTMLWFSPAKGYGFVWMDGEEEGKNDILVHKKNLELGENGKKPELEKGDRISFYLGDPPENATKDRAIAIEVKKIASGKEE